MTALSILNALIGTFDDSKIIYSVDDVVRVIVNNKTKQTALAYIRAVHLPFFYSVEFFNYKPKQNWIGSKQLKQITTLFNVLNEEYVAVIDTKHIAGSSLWNENKSNKAIKSTKRYNHRLFVNASRYGDIKLVQHIMSMKDYPNNPTIYHYVYRNKYHKKTKTVHTKISAFYAAVFYNHVDIVKLFLSQKQETNINITQTTVQQNAITFPVFRRITYCDVLKCNDVRYKNVKFYNRKLFAKLCRESNIKMLQTVLQYGSWPIYSEKSFSLHNTCRSGNLKVLTLLLNYVRNPNFINMAMPFDTKCNLLIPATNLNLINCAVSYKHLHIIQYILTEWKYKHHVKLNQAIYHPQKPHTLPVLVHAIMQTNLDDLSAFTLQFINFLTQRFDSDEMGLNWYCKTALNDQRQNSFEIKGSFESVKLSENKCFLFRKLNAQIPSMFESNMLWLSRGMIIGSLLSAVVYKCEVLWNKWYAYHDDDLQLKHHIQQLIAVLIESGMNWNIYKYEQRCEVQNAIVSYYNPHPHNLSWKVVHLDDNICLNEQYKTFMRNTISQNIKNYRKSLCDAFVSYYHSNYINVLDKKLIFIFESDILDFVVSRDDVVNHIKYFKDS